MGEVATTTRGRDMLALGAGLKLALTHRARAQAPVTLQFWEGHSAQEEAATIRMIEAFEAANPDIKINRTKVNFGADFERITMASAPNTLPDVRPIWSGCLTQFADAGAFISTLPLIAMFLLLQRFITTGLDLGVSK